MKDYIERALNEAIDPKIEYNSRMKEIDSLMKQFHKGLKEHQKRQMKDSKNWGFSSDLDFIIRKMKEINNFF